MNMNCSGHAELRDPDWYDPGRSLDRARYATVDTDTASRMHNSLTSLNIDSFTIAEMNDQSFNHFSVRSLPVISSNTTTTTRIATAPDAPWNESPRSLRGVSGISISNNVPAINAVRSTRAMKPPPGVSALDHLQNSLSNIMVSATVSNSGLPHDIVTLEDDSEYESLAGDQEDSLHGSFVSLRLADVMSPSNEHNEMDETAHTGNVRRAYNRATANHNSNNYTPVSPLRSMTSPVRTNLNTSYTSNRSTSSPTRNGSTRLRYYNGGAVNDVPSFSTLDEHTEYYNDGCDLGDNDDDNNMEIIKVLRAQIDTLKNQLLKQQEQNQKLKHQYEYKNEMSQFLPMDSIVQHGNAGLFSYGNDSFISTRSSNSGNNNNNKFQCDSRCDDVTKSPSFVQQQQQISDAEIAIFGSIAALKSSFRKQQSEKENRGVRISVNEQHPVSPESDDSTNNVHDTDDEDCASLSLLDELVLCELEAHVKTVQRNTKLQFETLKQQNEKLQAQVSEQMSLLKELERQVLESKAGVTK